MSNQFRVVKQWMEDSGQEIPHKDTSRLYEELMDEETDELFVEINGGGQSHEIVKEVLDVLWVCYGYLAAMGLDGDKLFMDLAENNYKKIEHRVFRSDGKLGVPADIKEQLKAEINEKISRELQLTEGLRDGDLDI